MTVAVQPRRPVIYPQPDRLVVIGDLNGHDRLLEQLLFGAGVIDTEGAWVGGETRLVQLGDVVNRGHASRAALERLQRLTIDARAAGGDVVVLLGNHEVMTALRHEAYVTADEYLEFADDSEVERFLSERTRFIYELLGPPDRPRQVEPILGRLQAWEEANAPGKDSFRLAFSEQGGLGGFIRSLPVAVRFGDLGFVHGGLSPQWAEQGLEVLDRLASEAWQARPAGYHALHPDGLFRDPLGPLWHRVFCVAEGRAVSRDVSRVASALGVERIVVGHTRTDSVEGGRSGWPLLRQEGRVVMADVGIGEPGEPGSALVIEDGQIDVWSPIHGRQHLCPVIRN